MLIDSDRLLSGLKDRVLADSYCAMDVEFMRRKSYVPELSLLMLSIADHEPVLIDPFVVTDKETVRSFLANPQSLKIFHSCSQDLEALLCYYQTLPEPLFDSQIAAAFCGMPFMMSFAALIEDCLGISLDKKMQRSDWSKRPLTAAQIDYAENEVHHLLDAYHVLAEKLETLGRMAWVEEECAQLTKDYEKNLFESRTAVSRVRGAGKLGRRDLSYLHLLLKWREGIAVKANCPARWVLKDEQLLSVVFKNPQTDKQLQKVTGMKRGQAERYFDQIQALKSEAEALPENDLHPSLNDGAPTPGEKELIKRIRSEIDSCAEEMKIAKELIGTRADVSTLVRERNDEENRLMQGWRGELMKERLLSLLEPGS